MRLQRAASNWSPKPPFPFVSLAQFAPSFRVRKKGGGGHFGIRAT